MKTVLEKENPNLQTVRQYMLNNYLLCPRLFKLCQEFDTKQTEAMLKGKIFEGLLLGFKSEEEKNELFNTKIGKPKTCIPGYIAITDKLKQLFVNGEHHERIFIQINDEYQLSFEPDYVGEILIQHTGEIELAIVDLKLTGDINKIWDYKSKKEDYFQACSYTWAVYQKIGEILPFYYFVVEDNDFETPVYRLIEMIITPADLDWFEGLIETAINDIFLEPNANHCLGSGKFDPRCRLIQYCDFGRNKIGGTERIRFTDLPCEFEPVPVQKEEFKVSNVKPKVFQELPETGELEETSFEEVEKGIFKTITVCQDDLREGGYRCRNCRTVAIKGGDEVCSNCDVNLIWITEPEKKQSIEDMFFN